MKTNMKDEEVIEQYLTTRPNDCFETLYSRYVKKVYNRCYSLTKDSEKAQDFTHDIFIRMFSRLDRFQGRSSFSTWLYSISYNYCMDQIQVSKRMATTGLIDDMDYDTTPAVDADDSEYSSQYLSEAMNGLAPQERQIMLLKYQDGLDIRQIAADLDLSESAVKMRLKRSRDKVRASYETLAYGRA
ncbi:MAG: sigma-70 family RNA polymerase sigma factor [Bacteroidetes bacterium]|nr:sigma-70 family RNA polymerase sigma factor [Fibrella sp.]